VDIRPPTLVGVFPPQIEMYTLEQLWNENCVTLWNNSNEQITIQEVQMDHAFGTMYWDVNPSYLLPHVLDLGEDMTVAVELLVPLAAPVRDTISTLMRVIYTQGAMNIPVITTRELLAMEAADAVNPAQRESISFYPNPFHCAVTINFATHPKADSQLSIYNTKGQLIRKFTFSEQENAVETVWDGSDEAGNPVPSGVYFYRFMSGKHRQTGKMTYLK
jgi:hypothetical protein